MGGGFPWIWVIVPLVSLALAIGGGSFFFLGGGDADTDIAPTPTPTSAVVPTAPSTETPGAGLTTPAPTEATPSVAVAAPVVGPIEAELVVPVTTYRIEASSPAGLPLSYRWFLEAAPGQECGAKSPSTSAPTDSAVASWSHANESPDNCDHDAPDHPFSVRVEVSDGVNPPVIRTYEGSNSGTGPSE